MGGLLSDGDGFGGRHLYVLVGAGVSTLVGGCWLLSLIIAGLANERSNTPVVGWGVVILVGAAAALVVPVVLSAVMFGARRIALLVGIVVATSIGGVLGLIAAAFALGVYSTLWPMAFLLALWTVVAMLSTLMLARRLRSFSTAARVLAVVTFLAAVTVAPGWWALITLSTDTSGWFPQAALAAPFGLGAGLGAGVAARIGRLGGASPHSSGVQPVEQGSVEVKGTDSVIGQLERLGNLKAQGVLTEDEFQAQKAKLLGGLPSNGV